MRRLIAALLFATLLGPSALAQLPALPGEAPQPITVTLSALAGPVTPGRSSVRSDAVVTVSCALAATSPQTGLPVSFTISASPAWTTILLDPPAAVVDPKGCTGPSVTIPVAVFVYGKLGGTAGDKADLTLEASATTQAGAQSGSATTPATLGYFGAFEIKPNTTSVTIEPRGSASVTLVVKNQGNARSRIVFETPNTNGVRTDPLDPVTIDPQASVDVQVRFTGTKDTLSGSNTPVAIKATSTRDGSTEVGDTHTQQVYVATKAAAPPMQEDKKSAIPLGPLALGALLVALARRRT